MEDIAKENQGFDIKEILQLFKKRWKLLLICLITSLFIGYLYVRYATERYSSHAKILIKDSAKNLSPADIDLTGVQLLNGNNGAESEAEILKSRMLIGIVVEKLKLNKSIYRYGGRAGSKKVELYDGSPFTVESAIDDSLLDNAKLHFKVNIIDRNSYLVESEEGKIQNVTANTPFSVDGTALKLVATDLYRDSWKNDDFEVVISPIPDVITKTNKSLKISTDKGDIGILDVIYEGGNIRKNNAIINELIFEHQAAAIREKNRIAENTNNFLTNRIALIEDKLRIIEEKGKLLKTEQGIVSVDAEVSSILLQEKELETELQKLMVNLELAKQMVDYVGENSNTYTLIPVNLGFENQSLTNTVQEYNLLVLKRNNLLVGSSEQNPLVQKIDNELSVLSINLKMSLNSLIASLNSQIKKVEGKLRLYRGEIANIPGYEMQYRDVMREQQISESIYLLLLQKKEENEIMLASTQGNIRVIDYAYSNGVPVSPKKKAVLVIAFLIGLLIPSIFILIRFVFDNKFKNASDLEQMGLPTIGEIPQHLEKQKGFNNQDPRSQTAEAFRLLRSNISFMLDADKASQVIMVTSTISGEGKTYVSLQLANSLANTMKKVAVVGMDLRAPKLMEYLDIPYTIGVSNYLVKSDMQLEEIMIPSPENELITFIPSGTIPPNPNEILLRPRVEEMFEQLKKEFDYIIVDTSPMGLVADTFSIIKHSDLLLYVARANFLDKRKLTIPLKLLQEKKLSSAIWVANGIDTKDNAYGYGYGYGSKEDKGKKKRLSKFRKSS